jgi:hypothetical protein
MTVVDLKVAASRPLGVAQELGASELGEQTVFSKAVVLTGEREVLVTRNGRWCLLDALRLLSRVVGDLQVVLPPGVPDVQAELDALLPTLWSQRTVRQIPEHDCNWAGAVAVLNIGTQVRPGLPWTSIIADGWVARCTSGTTPLSPGCKQDNPLSCLLAASFGVTEVFKRVYGVPREKAAPMEDAAFSLFEMSTSFSGLGPQLPVEIQLPNTLVLGAGAIGNGLVLLSSQLPLTGSLLLMDKQDFADENFGTCTLLDAVSWLGKPKAQVLGQWLRVHSALVVDGMKCTIETALADGRLEGRMFDLVINGLDDIDARKAVQTLWPRLVVDGAINSIGAAVVTHSMAHRELACLRCAFESPVKDHITEHSEVTGLSRTSLEGDQNRPISDEDIAKAVEHARPWLKEQQRLGQTICSTMGAAQASGLGLKLIEGFRPSVPFVAATSAALVMAQVLRNLLWGEERFVHVFQLASVFVGPDTALRVKRPASRHCECTRYRGVIDQLLAARPLVSTEP